MREDRAVSVTVSYVIQIGISTVLLTGLLIGAGSLIDRQTTGVATTELEVNGNRLAGDLMAADRLGAVAYGTNTTATVTDPGATTVRVNVDLPRSIAGEPYRIEVTETAIVLSVDRHDLTVSVPYEPLYSDSIGTTAFQGGPVTVTAVYDDPGVRLEVTRR
ncbi:DUF7266 family protein [Halalkalirubrum salinum]|uniref:DUF7266 family protein n=1 Tax=Halalkalirubrum salinum TaxID=2563889 RepID=UPI0010FAD7CD|nr:hypothetical protein [Halalkalirubrum salinum]